MHADLDALLTATYVLIDDFLPKRRNMHYEVLGDPFCRERDVPRMLALATSREGGDVSVPAELRFYPARSRTGREARTQ